MYTCVSIRVQVCLAGYRWRRKMMRFIYSICVINTHTVLCGNVRSSSSCSCSSSRCQHQLRWECGFDGIYKWPSINFSVDRVICSTLTFIPWHSMINRIIGFDQLRGAFICFANVYFLLYSMFRWVWWRWRRRSMIIRWNKWKRFVCIKTFYCSSSSISSSSSFVIGLCFFYWRMCSCRWL